MTTATILQKSSRIGPASALRSGAQAVPTPPRSWQMRVRILFSALCAATGAVLVVLGWSALVRLVLGSVLDARVLALAIRFSGALLGTVAVLLLEALAYQAL